MIRSVGKRKERTMDRFKKVKRVLAIIGIILIAGMYIMSLVSALAKWENSQAYFFASLAATIVVPVFIYLIELFYKMGHKKDDGTD